MGFAFNRPYGLMTPDRGERMPGRGLGFEGKAREQCPPGSPDGRCRIRDLAGRIKECPGTMAGNVMLREDRPERLLERLVEIGDRFRLQSLDPQIQACRQGLREDGVIDVAVLGRFKAGKSSFLNCILEQGETTAGVRWLQP